MSLLEQSPIPAPNLAHTERPLFDGDKPAAVTPEMLDRLNFQTYEYEESGGQAPQPGVEDVYWGNRREAQALIERAQRSTESHRIPADKERKDELSINNSERVQTMARAVGYYGLAAAKKYGITPHRVELTSHLLSQSRLNDEPSLMIDDGAFITIALSLKEMKEATRVKQAAEAEAAAEALGLLGIEQENNEHLMHPKDMGPDTGEIALAAIANHRPIAKRR